MTTLAISATTYSVQSAKPSLQYGTLAVLPVASGSAEVLFRTPLDKIPANATITSATIVFHSTAAFTGTFQYDLRLITSFWTSGVTWGTKPTTSGVVESVTKTNPAANTAWSFDVTTEVQGIVSGTTQNRGWSLRCTSATVTRVAGTTSAAYAPTLTVTYTIPATVPANLHPASGIVMVPAPVLTWDTINGTTQVNVQVDPAANAGTAWDSGAIASTGGLVDLATTSYPGLASGSATQWRARQNNGYGWSDWSPWVGFSRVADTVLTVLSPAAGDVEDGTPPVQWSVTGHTQVGWQVRLLDGITGLVIADSGRQAGTGTAWTPPRGLGTNGQTGVVEVTVWDDQPHAATATDPDHTTATVNITLALSGSVTPMTTLAVGDSGAAPDVILLGTRAAIPDFVDVYRDGVKVARHVGTDVFTGTNCTVVDLSAPVNRPVTYRLAPVVTGAAASGGPTVTVTPTCRGIWLIDADDPAQRAVIWTGAEQDQDQPELAALHQPLSGPRNLSSSVVRRRLARFRPQGSIDGTLVTVGAYTGADSEAFLRSAVRNDAGHLYRLVLGGSSPLVIVGDITFMERPMTTVADPILDVSFSWWGQEAD